MSQLITDQNGNSYILNDDNTLTPVNKPTPEEQLKEVAADAGKDVVKGELKDRGKEVLSGLFGSGSGSGAASGLGAGQSVQNGVIMDSVLGEGVATAVPNAAPSFFGGSLLEGGMGAGTMAAGAAGAYGLYDLSQNRERIGTSSGYAQGAASGAGIGMMVGGPVGAGIGATLGLAANALGIGAKSRTKIEQDARKRLAKEGIVIPNADVKEWELNEKFKESRNEADLTGKDIMHGSEFYGYKGYDKLDPKVQEEIANEALKRGIVREHHGTIDIGMDAAYEEYLKSKLGGGESTGGGGDNRRAVAENKKDRKRAQLAAIMPELNQPIAKPNRYDIDLSPVYKNPYL